MVFSCLIGALISVYLKQMRKQVFLIPSCYVFLVHFSPFALLGLCQEMKLCK